MNAASFLAGVIDIAIGIAGFAGIVAAVRQRRLTHWPADQRILLQILFTAAAAAIVFALLPAFLTEAGLAADRVWRVASAALICWILGAINFRLRQGKSLGVSMQIPRHVQAWGLLSVVLLAHNVIATGVAWPYLFGIMGLLMNGFSVFMILVLHPAVDDDASVVHTESTR